MAFTFTDQNFEEIIASGQPVAIDFWATWCGPCMKMSPIIDQCAQEYEGKVLIGKANIEDETEMPVTFGIRSIPTVLFFKNGTQVTDLRLTGAQSVQTLKEHLDKLLAL